jgi:hypothetical protein
MDKWVITAAGDLLWKAAKRLSLEEGRNNEKMVSGRNVGSYLGLPL